MKTDWRARLKAYHLQQGVYAGTDSEEYQQQHSAAMEKLRSNRGNTLKPEDFERHYDAIAEDYAKYLLDPEYVESISSAIKRIAEITEGQKIVRVHEAGCGAGLDVCFLAVHFPEIEFTASDISEGMLEIARRRADSLGIMNTRFLKVAHENLTPELLGGQVDLCFAIGALFYHSEEEFMTHMWGLTSVINPQGKLVLCTPGGEYLNALATVMWIFNCTFDGEIKDSDIVSPLGIGTFTKTSDSDAKTVAMRLALQSQERW